MTPSRRIFTLLAILALLTACQKESSSPPQSFNKLLSYMAPTVGYPHYDFVTDDSMNVIVAYDSGPADKLAVNPYNTPLQIKLEKLDPFGETVWERTYVT